MGDNFGVVADPGYFNRRISDLQRQIDSLRSERRAAATTITEGDFVIENGGRIIVNGGEVTVNNGILQSAFLFLASQLRPEGVATFNFTPGSEWTVGVGRIQQGPDVAGVDGGILPVYLKTSTADVRIDHTVTSASANAVLDSVTKRITRSTSARRYKQDIEDHDLDPLAILKMRPRTWRDRREVKEDPSTQRRYIGFIAEELHDLGLTEFVEYNQDGKPDAISYDRISVATLIALKWLVGKLKTERERIDTLEATVQNQQAQINTLIQQVSALTGTTTPAAKRST